MSDESEYKMWWNHRITTSEYEDFKSNMRNRSQYLGANILTFINLFKDEYYSKIFLFLQYLYDLKFLNDEGWLKIYCVDNDIRFYKDIFEKGQDGEFDDEILFDGIELLETEQEVSDKFDPTLAEMISKTSEHFSEIHREYKRNTRLRNKSQTDNKKYLAKSITEEELLNYIELGWEIVSKLSSGKIIIRKKR